jgi:hypothetical protein
VARANGEFHVLALRPVAPGGVVLRIEGVITDRPSRYSIQVAWDEHIAREGEDLETLLDRYPWLFLNHSCDSNAMVRGRDLVAIRSILAGEEITFNYNTTEYDMAAPFACHCGSPFCAGEIRGFKGLSTPQRERLRPWLSEYLLRILEGEPVPSGAVESWRRWRR